MPDSYGELPPSPRLAGYVECYWWRSQDRHEATHSILPDGCADILFSKRLEEPLSLTAVGLMTVPRPARMELGQFYFGVRFRPGMAAGFVPGVALLKDEIRPLGDVLASGERTLFERLAESRTPGDMAVVMERFLRPLEPADPGQRLLRQLANTELPLDQLISQFGLSVRHFRRLCVERAGVSPKYLRRIVRFRKAVQRLGNSTHASWAHFAAACGYYDQAHFIREFQEFAGCTPGRFLQSRGRALA